MGPDFLLMKVNAKSHRVLRVDELLESANIRRMDWPARSPDLNPIEHFWDALGRAIATRNPPENTASERVGSIATGSVEQSYFHYDITLRSLYSCKRGQYPLLTHFFCVFCNRCFRHTDFHACYAQICVSLIIVACLFCLCYIYLCSHQIF